MTTNLPFENWTEVLGSERLTGAALDRLTQTNRDTPTVSGEIDTTQRRHFRPPRAAVFNRRQQSLGCDFGRGAVGRRHAQKPVRFVQRWSRTLPMEW